MDPEHVNCPSCRASFPNSAVVPEELSSFAAAAGGRADNDEAPEERTNNAEAPDEISGWGKYVVERLVGH